MHTVISSGSSGTTSFVEGLLVMFSFIPAKKPWNRTHLLVRTVNIFFLSKEVPMCAGVIHAYVKI